MRRTREQRGFNHLALPALLTLAALLAFTARADFRYEYTGQLLEGTYGFDGETVAGQTGPISLRLSLEDSYVPGTPFSIDFVTGLALLALRAYGAGSGARCTPAPVERTPHRISGVVWLSFGDGPTNSL
jgi:hypothetical protein